MKVFIKIAISDIWVIYDNVQYVRRLRFTKSMVATCFNVDVRTIERYVTNGQFPKDQRSLH